MNIRKHNQVKAHLLIANSRRKKGLLLFEKFNEAVTQAFNKIAEKFNKFINSPEFKKVVNDYTNAAKVELPLRKLSE